MRNVPWIAALALAAIGCPEDPPPAAHPQTPVATAAPPQATGGPSSGRRLYLTACANCHGPDGTGSMMRQALPTIGDLGSPEMHTRLSDADMVGIVTNGRNNKMPGFGPMFNAEQTQAIVTYVRTLKRAQ